MQCNACTVSYTVVTQILVTQKDTYIHKEEQKKDNNDANLSSILPKYCNEVAHHVHTATPTSKMFKLIHQGNNLKAKKR